MTSCLQGRLGWVTDWHCDLSLRQYAGLVFGVWVDWSRYVMVWGDGLSGGVGLVSRDFSGLRVSGMCNGDAKLEFLV